MAENVTRPTGLSVEEFLASVDHDRRRREAFELDALFRRVTGWNPVMWGPSIVGYGSYHYRYESGREGESLATGFSPRKAKHSIYILPGYDDHGPILERLGKHSTGRSCLYVTRLDAIDLDVLAELIRAGLEELGRRWPVRPS